MITTWSYVLPWHHRFGKLGKRNKTLHDSAYQVSISTVTLRLMGFEPLSLSRFVVYALVRLLRVRVLSAGDVEILSIAPARMNCIIYLISALRTSFKIDM